MSSKSVNKLSLITREDVIVFDRIYGQYSKAVYANIFKIVKQHEIAEDIQHEVFISFWENRERIDQDKSAAGWLFVVSSNKAITYLKKKVKESIVFVESYELFESVLTEDISSENSYLEQLAIIEEAAKHLSPRIKEVFRLSRFEGYSVDEVAAQLGLTASSVKDYLKQSTQFIRIYIANRFPASGTVSLILLYIGTH